MRSSETECCKFYLCKVATPNMYVGNCPFVNNMWVLFKKLGLGHPVGHYVIFKGPFLSKTKTKGVIK